MIKISSILCPLDLSDASARAYDYATALATWYRASLATVEMIWVGLPAVPATETPLVLTPELIGDFKDELDRFVKARTPAGLDVATVLREGPMVDGILEEAQARSADLIVMGSHGRSGFDRLVLGSVAEKVLRKARCPVLIVPACTTQRPREGRPFKTIVCAVDFSPASLKAVKYAVLLAGESGGRLLLLHVFDWPSNRTPAAGLGPETAAARRQYDDDARRELHAAVPDDVRQWCDTTEITAIGKPYEEVLQLAGERNADLIVMGVHGRNSMDLALFGSTTNHVVRKAPCPVLTIRP